MQSSDKPQTAFLDPRELKVRSEPSKALKAVVGEVEHSGIVVRPLFPYSNPNRFLSITSSDGKEIGVVGDPEALDAQTRQLLLEAARKTRRIPQITKINALREAFGTAEWDVETNEGPLRFQVRGGRENIRIIGKRAVITDVENGRFEIADLELLDSRSRLLVDPYV